MSNKLRESHRIVLPEAREVIINLCRDCRFFVAIQGAREQRQGYAIGARKWMARKYVCDRMIIIVPEDWLASIMTDRRMTVILRKNFFGRSHAVDVNTPNKIIAKDLDLIFLKSILKEMALWMQKN